jgi:glycerol-3-phosphate acyltransferase PlsY
MFTPFLNFHGGKALATSFGVWTALTLYMVPTVFGVALGISIWRIKNESLAMLMGVISVFLFLLVFHFDLVLLSTWIINAILLIWRYSDKFKSQETSPG